VYGQPPHCLPSSTGDDGPKCFDKLGAAVCCTAPCQVIARSEPTWHSQDADNLATGGVIGRFKPEPDSSGLCGGNDWKTVFHVSCASLLPASQLIGVKSTMGPGADCAVNMFFASPAACASFTITLGWVLVACFCALLFLYVVLGVLLAALLRGRLDHPHNQQWKQLLHLVSDGCSVIKRALGKCTAVACLGCLGRCPGWGDAARGETDEFAHASAGAARRQGRRGTSTCLACVQVLIGWRDRPVVGPHIHAHHGAQPPVGARQDSMDAADWLSPELTQDALSVGSSSDGFDDRGSEVSSSDEEVTVEV